MELDTPAPPAEATRDERRTLLVSSLAVFAVFLDTTILFVAFPDITRSFPDVAATNLSWILNGYTIVFGALLIPLGRYADRRGHRAMFLSGSAVFTLGSVLCAIAPSPQLLIAARVVQAIGGAALVPSSLALVLRSTPAPRVPISLAIWGAMGAVAGAVGPTLGAALVEIGGWRWVFIINLPVGIATVLLGRRFLHESRQPDTTIPAPLGVALLMTASALIALGLVRGEDWGWSSTATLASLIGGLGVLLLFVAHQSRTTAPTIELALFRVRNFAWGNAASLAFGIAFTTMFLAGILFLTNVWRWSILSAGFGVAPGPALVAVLAPRMGRRAARIGQRPLLIAGGIAFAIAGAWRIVALGGDSAYVTEFLPTLVLTALGVALCLPQLSSVIGQALPPTQLGVGGAVNQAIRQFAGTIGVALTVGLLGTPTSLEEALAHFDQVWWILVVGGVITSLCALPLRTSQGQRR
jgi:EmrB/QacA subfamily drug resistance transporter